MTETLSRAAASADRPDVEPRPARLPYPGPESPETYTPAIVQVVALNDGLSARPISAVEKWLAQAFEGMARMQRDPANAAYIASRIF